MKNLALMREEIDVLDRQLISLLGERFQITERVGVYKAEHALPAADLLRENNQFDEFRKLAKLHNVDADLVEGIYRNIIEEVIARHKKMIN